MEENMNQTPPAAQNPTPGANSRRFGPRALLLAIVIIFGVLLVAIAISNHSNKPKNQPNTAAQAPAQAKVTLNDDGFVPATITVNHGTQLTWTNRGSSSHQVAADPYPLNNSIPGFDSTRSLLPGDSLTFTFDRTGTYHLHDQLNPLNAKLRETVIVK